MCNKPYNGYTNYETWNVNLWLDNDQGTQEYCNELTNSTWEDSTATEYSTKYESARHNLADNLKDYVEELNDEVLSGASMAADLLGAALQEVNWIELAENYLDNNGYTADMTDDDNEDDEDQD